MQRAVGFGAPGASSTRSRSLRVVSFSGTSRSQTAYACSDKGVRLAQKNASLPIHYCGKYSYKRLKLAVFNKTLGQLGGFLTCESAFTIVPSHCCFTNRIEVQILIVNLI